MLNNDTVMLLTWHTTSQDVHCGHGCSRYGMPYASILITDTAESLTWYNMLQDRQEKLRFATWPLQDKEWMLHYVCMSVWSPSERLAVFAAAYLLPQSDCSSLWVFFHFRWNAGCPRRLLVAAIPLYW